MKLSEKQLDVMNGLMYFSEITVSSSYGRTVKSLENKGLIRVLLSTGSSYVLKLIK